MPRNVKYFFTEVSIFLPRNLSSRVSAKTGVVSDIGGITKFRTMADMKDTMLDSEEAFNKAISNSKNRQQNIGSEACWQQFGGIRTHNQLLTPVRLAIMCLIRADYMVISPPA